MDHDYLMEGIIAVVWLLISPAGLCLFIAILLRWTLAYGTARPLAGQTLTPDDEDHLSL